jgi:hypothetical protein
MISTVFPQGSSKKYAVRKHGIKLFKLYKSILYVGLDWDPLQPLPCGIDGCVCPLAVAAALCS